MRPDEVLQIEDRRFAALTIASARLEELFRDCRWAEGPVWFDDLNCLLWSDIPNNRILRWTPDPLTGDGVSVFRQLSNFANGHSRDLQGRLVSCEHGTRRVTRTEADGRITVLADRFEGRRLNSPNDVVVAGDGSIWFTDPTYGIQSDYEGFRADPEQPVRGVYRIDGHSGAIRRVAEDFFQPNGLAFSPDGTRLYVADSGTGPDGSQPRHIRGFEVQGDGLRGGGVVAVIDRGVPDGFRVDREGNLWSSAADGVQCFAPDGTRLGRILVPQTVSNLTFGGPRRNRLFLTATTSVYAIYVRTNGAQRP